MGGVRLGEGGAGLLAPLLRDELVPLLARRFTMGSEMGLSTAWNLWLSRGQWPAWWKWDIGFYHRTARLGASGSGNRLRGRPIRRLIAWDCVRLCKEDKSLSIMMGDKERKRKR